MGEKLCKWEVVCKVPEKGKVYHNERKNPVNASQGGNTRGCHRSLGSDCESAGGACLKV